jgi:CHRD domain
MKTGRARLVALGILASAVAVTATASAASASGDHDGRNSLRVHLTGYQEDPLTISTPASANFRATIDERAQTITYRLSYTALKGTVLQSHIHFGGSKQSGGIMVFLCSNLGNGPVGTQACPAGPATITGTIRPADVLALPNQGVPAGSFADLIGAIRANSAYVNVHSTLFPGGEIRGNIVN